MRCLIVVVALHRGVATTTTTRERNDRWYWREFCHEGVGCWPRVWLLGAQKAGTTSLFEFFVHHGGFCGARLIGVNKGKSDYFHKETKFWGRNDTQDPTRVSVNAYLELHPTNVLRCDNGFIEGDTMLLSAVRTPGVLSAVMPPRLRTEFRFLAVLREHVSREMSWYNHAKRDGFDGIFCSARHFLVYDDYAQCLLKRTGPGAKERHLGLWRSVYDLHLTKWAESFPRTNILVLAMDSILNDFSTCVSIIIDFLGIDPATISSYPRSLQQAADYRLLKLPHANVKPPSAAEQRDFVSCDVLATLQTFFGPWNDKLYSHLAADRLAGIAPAVEPPFPKFHLLDTCVPS